MTKPKKHTPATKQATTLTLSPEHLQEFRLRNASLQLANKDAEMIRESYQLFLSRILPLYGLAEATINLESGEITPKEKHGR